MDIYKQLSALPTTCLSDAAGSLGNMDPKIKPLKEEYRLCGPALTVSLAPNDNYAVLQAIRDAKIGEVLVVDAKSATYNTIAGDFVVGMAKLMGLAGIVVDGTIRDIIGVKKTDFPVFALGTTIAVGGKAGAGTIRQTISCGGVAVAPGDWIVGDADGVTVIAQQQVEQIILKAQEKERKDDERAQKVLVSRQEVIKYLDNVLKK